MKKYLNNIICGNCVEVMKNIKDGFIDLTLTSPPYDNLRNYKGYVFPYSCALRAGGSYNYLLVNGKRRLTDREMLRLQGFPEDFKINISYTQLRKMAGNSVTVIEMIAEQIKKAIDRRQPKAYVVQPVFDFFKDGTYNS